MVDESIHVTDDTLRVACKEPIGPIDLRHYSAVVLCALGKAALAMAQAVVDRLGKYLTDGVVVCTSTTRTTVGAIPVLIGGHPLPNSDSHRAAERVQRIASAAHERTLLINCVSGGASALCCAPYTNGVWHLSVADIQHTTSVLLAANASIHEINCVRKHLSALKGGRYLQLAAPARIVNVVLSDVVGDDLGTIASGLVAPDTTTYRDAMNILTRHKIEGSVLPAVRAFLAAGAAGEIPETPSESDLAGCRYSTILIGNNMRALKAALQRAIEHGFKSRIVTSRLQGNARHAAARILSLAIRTAQHELPCCLILGGETTVQLRGGGKGGRNQELALAFLYLTQRFMRPYPDAYSITLLSAATDGVDGPTDAAGGFADKRALENATAASLDIATYLDANNAYEFHRRCGTLLHTGATGTNVCDIQLVAVTQT